MMAQSSATSDQNGAATDQNNAAPAAAPSATDQNAPAAAAPANQNAPAASNGAALPQTGSELPLLGLLGLGTVGAGVWKAYYKK
ncbi:MAG TPA: LPXTG cell wall anchor domain-containing protein [Lacipirellulaceae bacterium]|nr:LPXTG cell wall anchor domain-containing protein [Lacipirellulaceae bacterium]